MPARLNARNYWLSSCSIPVTVRSRRTTTRKMLRRADFEDVFGFQEDPMHTRSAVRVVRIAVRLSLASGFLSAVADRFGWWESFGQGSWGSMGAFADYAHRLVPFASGWFLAVIVWAATATETTLGALLLTGSRPKLIGAPTCLLLITFG